MKLFKNKNSLHKSKEGQPREIPVGRIGSIVLTEGAVHAVDSEKTILGDMNQLIEDLSKEGFDAVSTGRGPWIEGKDARVIDEFAIKHPDGQVVTVSTYKFHSPTGSGVRSYPYVEQLTQDAYQEHVTEWQITTTPDQPLANPLIDPIQPEA